MGYANKTVLVTGAGGFLGRHLVARLAPIAKSVHCVTRALQPPSDRSVVYHFTNLLDVDATFCLFDAIRPDIVFHLASASGGSAGLENVLPHVQNDIVTTVNCLLAAERTKAGRVIVPGSLEEPALSEVESGPRSPYALAKMTCVATARMFYNSYHTPTVVCRIFMGYGPGQKSRKVVPYIITSLLAGRAPNLSSGGRLLDWIFIDDAIDALVLAGMTPNIDGLTLDIGSGQLVRLIDLAKRIQRLIPGAPAISDSASYPAEAGRAADLDKTSRHLGWLPKTALDTGLEATVEHYASCPLMVS
jgi:nucleoside-diphosphate-sugar epimerase